MVVQRVDAAKTVGLGRQGEGGAKSTSEEGKEINDKGEDGELACDIHKWRECLNKV
jgi:hypothetical protein